MTEKSESFQQLSISLNSSNQKVCIPTISCKIGNELIILNAAFISYLLAYLLKLMLKIVCKKQ